MPLNPLARPRLPVLTAIAALVIAAPVPSGADAVAGPSRFEYVCYRARPARPLPSQTPDPSFDPRSGVATRDRFGAQTVDLTKPVAFCDPADSDGDAPFLPRPYLVGYVGRPTRTRPRQSPFQSQAVQVFTRFGTLALRVSQPATLLVPSTSVIGGHETGVLGDSEHFRSNRCS